MTLSNLEQSLQQQVEQEAKVILDEARAAAEAHLERESARMREEHEHRIASARSELETTLTDSSCSRLRTRSLRRYSLEPSRRFAPCRMTAMPNG